MILAAAPLTLQRKFFQQFITIVFIQEGESRNETEDWVHGSRNYGFTMAANILRAGYPVTVYNRRTPMDTVS